MIVRTIKHCNHCGYNLTERVKEKEVKKIRTWCVCPHCGEKAHHILYVDERNQDL